MQKNFFRLNESGYIKSSKTPLYGFLAVIPLLVIYEILVVTVNQAQVAQVRNGADVIFKTLLDFFGLHGSAAYGLLLFGALILLLLLRRKGQAHFKPRFILFMALESSIYAAFLGYAVGTITGYVLSAGETTIEPVPQIMLSLGAGVYEELVFRAFLFGVTGFALTRLLSLSKIGAYTIAAVVSSLLFSSFHYLGNEPFEFYSFMFRFFAGLILCTIYAFRGYGIAAYTHTFYDLMVLF